MCDERSSGEVQVGEVKAALKSLGVHLSSALAAQIEQRYPARKRGKVSVQTSYFKYIFRKFTCLVGY
jgi:Ca2+-binding EF-hand superfamily protein